MVHGCDGIPCYIILLLLMFSGEKESVCVEKYFNIYIACTHYTTTKMLQL